MFDPFTLALIGAGVGGGLSLLRGGNIGDAAKNAAIGGGLGYAGGQFLPSAFGATPASATSASTATNAGGNFLAPTVGEVGMFNSFNPATGAPLADAAAIGSTADLTPLMTRMGQGTAYGGLTGTTSGTAMDSPFMAKLKGLGEYATPTNMIGLASVLDQPSATPPIMSGGGGGVRGGQAPSAEEIKNLLNTIRVQELVNRRRFA